MWYTRFEAMMSYKYSEIHKKVADEITKLYKDRHNIDIFKILFQYDDTMKMLGDYETKQVYPTEKSKIIQLFIYFTTNKQYHHYCKSLGLSYYADESEQDGMTEPIKSILDSNGFDTSKFHRALYKPTFEFLALHYIYCNSAYHFNEYKEKVFNPDTMSSIVTKRMLIIVYKSKELLERAKESGEIDRLKADYYDFMKKYDTYNLISKDDKGNYRHLFTRFDSPETELPYRNYVEDVFSAFLVED